MKLKQIAAAVIEAYMHRMGMLFPVLPLVVDTAAHTALPESMRALYVKADGADGDDGKFRLDVSGMPEIPDVTGLKTALDKERTRATDEEKARKALAKQFEGIDPKLAREMLNKVANNEEMKLISEGKIEEVINARMSKRDDEFKRQLEEAQSRADGSLEVASTYMDRVLDNHVRAACAAAGVHPSAVDDALLRASQIFSLDDDGNAVQLDGDGDDAQPVFGKDGKTPYSLTEWMEEMKEKAPHWFPAGASGGGAHNARDGKGGANTIKRGVFDAKNPTEQAAYIKAGGKVVD